MSNPEIDIAILKTEVDYLKAHITEIRRIPARSKRPCIRRGVAGRH
jgi:hypothetical protein